MNIPDDLNMGEMGMDRKGLKEVSHVNYITRLILDSHSSVLGIVVNQGEKIVIWSAKILGHVKVRTMPLYWRRERGHWRLGVTLTLLGKMFRRH